MSSKKITHCILGIIRRTCNDFKAFGVITWLHAQHAIVVHVKSLTVWQNVFVKLDGFCLIAEDIIATATVSAK